MQRHRGIIVVAVALTLLIPISTAEWAGRGFYEPDTRMDRDDGFMYSDPDTNPSINLRQVYFNVYAGNGYTGGNPNVAGSHHITFPTAFNAFLGVWKDCNSDGYIGTVEGALLEYRAELLLDASICAPGTAHNDGEWVQEFLWIGPKSPADCGRDTTPEPENLTNPYVIDDMCARVWGDIGLPTDGGEITCPVTPLPRGTSQSTGGLVRYGDCIANYRVHETSVAVDDAVPDVGVQIGFGDAPRERPDQSQSVLNQKNPWGDPAADPYASAWDCSGERAYDQQDPTGGDLRRVGVADPTGAVPEKVGTSDTATEDGYLVAVNGTDDEGVVFGINQPGVPSLNPNGSPAGTANDTLEGAPYLGAGHVETGIDDVNPGNAGDCDRSGGIGWYSDPYRQVETDFEPAAPVRRNHDFTMIFWEGTRGSENREPEDELIIGLLGDATPVDLGQGLNRDFVSGPDWYANNVYLASRNGYLRVDDFSPKAVQYFSFYAHVTPQAISEHGLTLFNNGLEVPYGSDHCNGSTAITGDWDCDEENWWRGPGGEKIRTVWQVEVNQVYNLRDIDCYDEALVPGQPVTWPGVTTGTFCER